jgi:ADP-heptose:LPS heptosyltransferase
LEAEKIAAASAGAAILAPQTDLPHLAALAESTDLFISGDSGPLHIAAAVGTPAIGLYGATLATMTGPYGQIGLQKAYEKGSLRHRRAADNAAMRAITVDHVCAAIDEVQQRRRLVNAA